jgi:hypothetical protein
LITIAEMEMTLDEAQGDGTSLRTHLRRVLIMTGQCDPMLDIPPVPKCAAALWRLWLFLSGTRPPAMGLSPISHQEIAAAAHLYRLDLVPWEVETLLQLDRVAMSFAAKAINAAKKSRS